MAHESGFLRDTENEMNRKEKIHHTRITELEEDGKKLYKAKKELENLYFFIVFLFLYLPFTMVTMCIIAITIRMDIFLIDI